MSEHRMTPSIASRISRFRRVIFALRVITTLSCVLVLPGCNRSHSDNVEARIVSEIKAKCPDERQCQLRIKDITQFSWDRMFVFRYDATRVDVRNALGSDFPDFLEFHRRIIFMSNGVIVHGENEPTDIEHRTNGEVDFAPLDSQRFASFGPDVTFSVTKISIAQGTCYELTEVH
jgi:hypothetical protein